MRSYYAREMGKMKRSKKSGSGTDEVYKSKWAYFDTLDSFSRPQVTHRKSVSNLVSFLYHIPLPLYLTICIKVLFLLPPCRTKLTKQLSLDAVRNSPKSSSLSNIPSGVYIFLEDVFDRNKLCNAHEANTKCSDFVWVKR